MMQGNKTIVTVWWGFVDIDWLACSVAYAELLRLEWGESSARLTDPFNASITPALELLAQNKYVCRWDSDNYVIVDMSDPEKISNFAPLDQIVEIYDHHSGFESYWEERLGKKAKIELIWAAATLIWEEFKHRGFKNAISWESATLLAHAIISNTVNFLFPFTSHRDRESLRELEMLANLDDGWVDTYFRNQQDYIEGNISESVMNDTKRCKRWGEVYNFGQIEIWNSSEFLKGVNLSEIYATTGIPDWIFNCVEIKSGTTRILSNSNIILKRLSDKLWYPDTPSWILINRVILRKELLPMLGE